MHLINHSDILKEVKLQFRVIVGDEDSSMISVVRKDRPDITFYKLADKNHLAKNFTSELNEMQPMFKELKKKGAISNITKFFLYQPFCFRSGTTPIFFFFSCSWPLALQ